MEETIAEQENDKTETPAIWIIVVLVVVLILAGMGWNMWTHPDWDHGAEAEAGKTQLVRAAA